MYTTGRNCVILLLSAPGGQTRAKRLCRKGIAVFMYQSVMQAFFAFVRRFRAYDEGIRLLICCV